MSSLMGSHGVVLATAMAVSGTVVLLVFCRQRPVPPAGPVVVQEPSVASPFLRPCISVLRKSGGKAATKKKPKKRVHFAEEVVELRADFCNVQEEELELEEKVEEGLSPSEEEAPAQIPSARRGWSECGRQVRGEMPPNRLALYSGILRDRHSRMTCSY